MGPEQHRCERPLFCNLLWFITRPFALEKGGTLGGQFFVVGQTSFSGPTMGWTLSLPIVHFFKVFKFKKGCGCQTHAQNHVCKFCIIPKDLSKQLSISNQTVFWCDKCYFLPHWKELWRMTDQLGMGLGRRGSLPQKKNQGRRKLMSPTSANQNIMSAAKKERKHTFINDLLCTTNSLYQNKLYVWKDELRADIQT